MTTTRTARPATDASAFLAYPTYEDQLMDELDLAEARAEAHARYAR